MKIFEWVQHVNTSIRGERPCRSVKRESRNQNGQDSAVSLGSKMSDKLSKFPRHAMTQLRRGIQVLKTKARHTCWSFARAWLWLRIITWMRLSAGRGFFPQSFSWLFLTRTPCPVAREIPWQPLKSKVSFLQPRTSVSGTMAARTFSVTGVPDFVYGFGLPRRGSSPFRRQVFWSFYSLWMAKMRGLFIKSQELCVKFQELFVDNLSGTQPKISANIPPSKKKKNALCQALPGQVRVDRLTRKPYFRTPNRKSWTFCRLRDFGHSMRFFCFLGRYSADIGCRNVLKVQQKNKTYQQQNLTEGRLGLKIIFFDLCWVDTQVQQKM